MKRSTFLDLASLKKKKKEISKATFSSVRSKASEPCGGKCVSLNARVKVDTHGSFWGRWPARQALFSAVLWRVLQWGVFVFHMVGHFNLYLWSQSVNLYLWSQSRGTCLWEQAAVYGWVGVHRTQCDRITPMLPKPTYSSWPGSTQKNLWGQSIYLYLFLRCRGSNSGLPTDKTNVLPPEPHIPAYQIFWFNFWGNIQQDVGDTLGLVPEMLRRSSMELEVGPRPLACKYILSVFHDLFAPYEDILFQKVNHHALIKKINKSTLKIYETKAFKQKTVRRQCRGESELFIEFHLPRLPFHPPCPALSDHTKPHIFGPRTIDNSFYMFVFGFGPHLAVLRA